MPLSPETLARHELVGLYAAVADAPNPDLVGIRGRVVGETRNTLSVSGGTRATVRQVPKRETTFAFALPAGESRPGRHTDEAAADRKAAGTAFDPEGRPPGDDVAYVTVDGGVLCSRPARRTEDTPAPGGDDRWR